MECWLTVRDGKRESRHAGIMVLVKGRGGNASMNRALRGWSVELGWASQGVSEAVVKLVAVWLGNAAVAHRQLQ